MAKEITVPLELHFDKTGCVNSKTYFRHELVSVSDDEGNTIGNICGGIGGGILLHDEKTETTWMIPYEDLWNAFIEALEEDE